MCAFNESVHSYVLKAWGKALPQNVACFTWTVRGNIYALLLSRLSAHGAGLPVGVRVADCGWKTTSVGQITFQIVKSNLTGLENLTFSDRELLTLLQWCRRTHGASLQCDRTVSHMKHWLPSGWITCYGHKPNRCINTCFHSSALGILTAVQAYLKRVICKMLSLTSWSAWAGHQHTGPLSNEPGEPIALVFDDPGMTLCCYMLHEYVYQICHP